MIRRPRSGSSGIHFRKNGSSASAPAENRNSARQWNEPAIIPPAIGPAAPDAASTAATAPSARPLRSSRTKRTGISIVSDGMAEAPIPCAIRAAISVAKFPAKKPKIEPAANVATPKAASGPRPNLSAGLPYTSAPAARRTYYLTWKESRNLSRAAEAFRDFVIGRFPDIQVASD